ncbi:MAG: DNA gyrase subunit A [Myxococcales bacterium]|nr:DNA gyrase subunit A [Myxococcales bacterium]
MEPTGRGNQLPVAIEDEMRVSYLDYAMSVIIGRALPDVRDGLKPVHRRALYTMYELKNNWNGPYKKSARIVGDCIGKYHPHGDQAVYDTIVRMAQDFSMRNPLVDGQGNFGSVDGDPPAAMRYTEVRMAKIAHELLADIEKETVEHGTNYDDSLREPLVLPTKIPNLLINGSTGIAVGMATNIPPHNLLETVNAALAVMRNPDISLGELMQIVPGPDFPTGGTIYGTRGIREAYETGRGIIRVRAVTEVEEMSRDRERIVVTELPYQVNKARLLEKIAELVREKRIEGISDLRDESDRQGMRMVIELKRDAQAQVVLNQLYKLTALQSSFGINMLAIVHGEPRVLGLKEVLEHFIDHRRDVTLRRTRYDLRKAEERAHILEGLKIALDFIDEVIRVIRQSPTADVARESLMSEFGLSEIQARAILEMRLRRLTGLEREEIIRELEALREKIAEYRLILQDEGRLLDVIESEMIAVRDAFADERRTQITIDDADLNLEDLIPVEDMVVTVSHGGYIKRVPLSEYRTQKRGGRGKTGMGTKEEDFVEHLFVASTHAHMLFFTSAGRVFSERVFSLPAGSRIARGKPIWTLFPLEDGEKLAMVLSVDEFTEGDYLLFATAQGQVKKTDLMAYSNIRSSGIIAINLNEGDRLIAVRQTTGHSDILLATANGMAIRFKEEDVRAMGRDTTGVRGINLEDDDAVVGCISIDRTEEGIEDCWVLTATANGYGKRTPLSEYLRQRTQDDGSVELETQSRGGKGMYDIKTTERNGKVVGIVKIEADGDDYLMVTDGGTIIRASAGDVSIYKRNTQGVRLINVSEGEEVVSLARYAESDEDEDDELESSDVAAATPDAAQAEDASADDGPADDEG